MATLKYRAIQNIYAQGPYTVCVTLGLTKFTGFYHVWGAEWKTNFHVQKAGFWKSKHRCFLLQTEAKPCEMNCCLKHVFEVKTFVCEWAWLASCFSHSLAGNGTAGLDLHEAEGLQNALRRKRNSRSFSKISFKTRLSICALLGGLK